MQQSIHLQVQADWIRCKEPWLSQKIKVRLYFRRAQHPSLRGADDDPTTLNLAEVCVRAVGSPR